MKSIALFIRRTHLYMTLLCLPWFVMYGITALAMNHPRWFADVDDLYNLKSDRWSVVERWSCDVEVPDEGEVPREVGAELLRRAGLNDQVYSVGRWDNGIAVYIGEVWHIRRLMYDPKRQQLELYSHQPDMRVFLAGLHSKAGYIHRSWAADLWAVMVDVVSFGILIWIASGLYMWWRQRGMRVLGWAGLSCGCLAFGIFLWAL